MPSVSLEENLEKKDTCFKQDSSLEDKDMEAIKEIVRVLEEIDDEEFTVALLGNLKRVLDEEIKKRPKLKTVNNIT